MTFAFARKLRELSCHSQIRNLIAQLQNARVGLRLFQTTLPRSRGTRRTREPLGEQRFPVEQCIGYH